MIMPSFLPSFLSELGKQSPALPSPIHCNINPFLPPGWNLPAACPSGSWPHAVFHTAKKVSKHPQTQADSSQLALGWASSQGDPDSRLFQSFPCTWLMSCQVTQNHVFSWLESESLTPVPNPAMGWPGVELGWVFIWLEKCTCVAGVHMHRLTQKEKSGWFVA